MSQEPIEIVPAARTWRDISQPVRVRAMSRGGRWRHTMDVVKTTAAIAVFVALGWGVLTVFASTAPGSSISTSSSTPLRKPVLVTDHVLHAGWLERTLGLPKHTSLMQLDLEALRERVLADTQVLAAEVTRQFPDTLIVRIEERTPVARAQQEDRTVLVAADGVVFAGLGYEETYVQTLPLLRDIELETLAGSPARIAGMKPVSELLHTARLEAPHLYRTWSEVSLARLADDGEIEVRASAPVPVLAVFKADDKLLSQIARLSWTVENLPARPDLQARIDLTLGAMQVPVSWSVLNTLSAPRSGSAAPATAPAVKPVSAPAPATAPVIVPPSSSSAASRVIAFPNLQSKAKREF